MANSCPLKMAGFQAPISGWVWAPLDSREETAGLVQAGIRAGYRHLDCACDYGNEAEVGAGLRAVLDSGTCRRGDLW